MKLLFLTGNQNKADKLSEYLGIKIDHEKLDLDEVQSMDSKEIARHKLLQAYDIVKRPVLVDDVSLEFDELNGLPGPFVRYFVDNLSLQQVCNLVRENRKATGRCTMGYYDGENEVYFEGSIRGDIALEPAGSGGFGWDQIFITEGYTKTRAELDEEDYEKIYLKIRKIEDLKKFLESEGY